MKIDSVHIADIHHAVAVNVRAGKIIPGQCDSSLRVEVSFVDIAYIYTAVTVDIALQMYFHILRHIFRTHCDRVLTGNMAVLGRS